MADSFNSSLECSAQSDARSTLHLFGSAPPGLPLGIYFRCGWERNEVAFFPSSNGREPINFSLSLSPWKKERKSLSWRTWWRPGVELNIQERKIIVVCREQKGVSELTFFCEPLVLFFGVGDNIVFVLRAHSFVSQSIVGSEQEWVFTQEENELECVKGKRERESHYFPR